jgi:hypothetical protein
MAWSKDSYNLNTVAGGATLAFVTLYSMIIFLLPPILGEGWGGVKQAGAVAIRQRGPPGLRAKII